MVISRVSNSIWRLLVADNNFKERKWKSCSLNFMEIGRVNANHLETEKRGCSLLGFSDNNMREGPCRISPSSIRAGTVSKIREMNYPTGNNPHKRPSLKRLKKRPAKSSSENLIHQSWRPTEDFIDAMASSCYEGEETDLCHPHSTRNPVCNLSKCNQHKNIKRLSDQSRVNVSKNTTNWKMICLALLFVVGGSTAFNQDPNDDMPHTAWVSLSDKTTFSELPQSV